MAPNPSFEDPDPYDISVPEGWSTDTWQGPPAYFHWYYLGHSGERSVYIRSNKPASRSRWQTVDNLAASPGNRYYFSGWVRTDDLMGQALLTLSFWDEALKPLGDFESPAVISDTDWIQIGDSAVAPPGAAWVRFEARLHGAGSVWFDDVSLDDVQPAPIFQVALQDDPDPVDAGSHLTYTLAVSNVGNLIEEAFTVTLSLDDHLRVDSTVPPTDSQEGNILIWAENLPVLYPDATTKLTVVATVDAPLPEGLQLYSVAKASGQEAAPVTDTELTTVRSAPDLTVAKLAPPTITAGQELTYTITFTNVGNAAASKVWIVEDYPRNPNCFDSSSLPVLWDFDNVQPMESHTIRIAGPVSPLCPEGTILNNEVIGIVGQSETNSSAQTRVNGLPTPVWQIALSPLKPSCQFRLDEQQSCDYEIENTGNQTVTNIHFTASNSLGWPDDQFFLSPLVVEQLEPGDTRGITVRGTPPLCVVSGTRNALTLMAAGEPEVSAHATATIIVGPYMEAKIEAGSTHVVAPQETLTFRRQITNLSNFTTTFLLVNDVPAGWGVTWTPSATITLAPCPDSVGSRVAQVDHPPEQTNATLLTKLVPLANPSDVLDTAVDDVQVRTPRIYLPMVFHPCIPPPFLGPLESGEVLTYSGTDWYYVDLAAPGTLSVTVQDLNVDGNLLFYGYAEAEGCQVTKWGDLLANFGGNLGGQIDPMELSFQAPEAMRVYIYVYVTASPVPTYTFGVSY